MVLYIYKIADNIKTVTSFYLYVIKNDIKVHGQVICLLLSILCI